VRNHWTQLAVLGLGLALIAQLAREARGQAAAGAGSAADERFVAVGTLDRHAVARNGTPRYALKDEQGATIGHVAAAAGLDLAPYTGRRVGVTARAVSYADQSAPFILAERVTPLDARPKSGGVRTASFEQPAGQEVSSAEPVDEEIPPGAAVWDDLPTAVPMGLQPTEDLPYAGPGCHACGHVPGPACGTEACGTCSNCPCGPSGVFWVRPEYLLWRTRGMRLPPLVTTSPTGTPAASAGVLGRTGTEILYGDEEVLDGSRSGFRLKGGMWLDCCNWIGVEGEYLFLGEESESFAASSEGDPILARPFFNVLLNQQDSELVAFPGTVSGEVTVQTETELQGAGARMRVNLCCEQLARDPCRQACGRCGSGGGHRLDGLVGYRWLQLDERLGIREVLVSGTGQPQTDFDLRDQFETDNDFHGVDLGLLWEGYSDRWTLELLGKIALGNTHRVVRIDGSTVATTGNVPVTNEGGLLALSSNIGQYSDDKFSVIPEFGATLGYCLTSHLRLTVGYTFLYWSHVVRPGDQVDLGVNTDLLPPPIETEGPQRPAFAMNDTDYWAQGMNFGLDYRW